jgi:hypothetical protein
MIRKWGHTSCHAHVGHILTKKMEMDLDLFVKYESKVVDHALVIDFGIGNIGLKKLVQSPFQIL